MTATAIQRSDSDGSADNQTSDTDVIAQPRTVACFLLALPRVVQDFLQTGWRMTLTSASRFVQEVGGASPKRLQDLKDWIESLQVDEPHVALLASLLFESRFSAARRLDASLDRWAKGGIVAEPIVEALQCFAWLFGEASLRTLLEKRQQSVFTLVAAGLNRPIDPRVNGPLSQPFDDVAQLLTCEISRSQWEEIIHTIRFFKRDKMTGRFDGVASATMQRAFEHEHGYQNDCLATDLSKGDGARLLRNLTRLLEERSFSELTGRKVVEHINPLTSTLNDEIWREAYSLIKNHRENLLTLAYRSPADIQYSLVHALFSADADWATCTLFPLAWTGFIDPCILFRAVADSFQTIDVANKVYRPIVLDVVNSAVSAPDQFRAALRFLVCLTGASPECFFYLVEACDTEAYLNAAQDAEVFGLLVGALHHLLGNAPEKRQVAALWQLCLSSDRRKIDLGMAVLERRMPGLSRLLCSGFSGGNDRIRWGGNLSIPSGRLGTQKLYLASYRVPIFQATDRAFLRSRVTDDCVNASCGPWLAFGPDTAIYGILQQDRPPEASEFMSLLFREVIRRDSTTLAGAWSMFGLTCGPPSEARQSLIREALWDVRGNASSDVEMVAGYASSLVGGLVDSRMLPSPSSDAKEEQSSAVFAIYKNPLLYEQFHSVLNYLSRGKADVDEAWHEFIIYLEGRNKIISTIKSTFPEFPNDVRRSLRYFGSVVKRWWIDGIRGGFLCLSLMSDEGVGTINSGGTDAYDFSVLEQLLHGYGLTLLDVVLLAYRAYDADRAQVSQILSGEDQATAFLQRRERFIHRHLEPLRKQSATSGFVRT